MSKSPKTEPAGAVPAVSPPAVAALATAVTAAALVASVVIPPAGAADEVAARARADDDAADAAMNAAALALAGADRAAGELEPMTLAEACALVRIDPSDALAFKDHGTHVVVVTVAGQKLTTANLA